MSLLLFLSRRSSTFAILMAFPLIVLGQAVPQGGESSLIGPAVGDQVKPSISLNQNGGYVVWEQNGNAKTGLEIYAAELDSSFSQTSIFRVNRTPKGDQMNAQVQLLKNGDALFVWQGYGRRDADIFARIISNGRLGREIRLNRYFKDQQSEPVITALNDGSAMVAWQSFGQDGSMFGIYLCKISDSGKLEGDEFLANQKTAFNQRSPALTTLANGNVVVVWISEQQRFAGSVDVYARLFTPDGSAISGELLLNSPTVESANNICANPSVAALPGGGFTVVWSEKDLTSELSKSNSWEIVGRSFQSDGAASGADFKINTYTFGDQYSPKIATVGNDCVVVWTSIGQDGSREGVYGRTLQAGIQPSGDEFRVNTTMISRQRYPSIASDGVDRFLVGWSSFVRVTSFDLFSQEYVITPQSE